MTTETDTVETGTVETSTVETDTPETTQQPPEAVGHLLQVLNDGGICILASIGHQTGLFETMSGLPPATSTQIADAAGLNERYVREWLAGVASAGLVDYERGAKTFALRPDHAPFVTGGGPDNLVRMLHLVTVMSQVSPKLVPAFRTGNGLSYRDYPDFHDLQAADSGPVHDAFLIDAILPLTGEIPRLQAGIDVVDLGCGEGHAVNLMARTFPNSRFTGLDFEGEAIAAARAEAAAWGLDNVTFAVCDIAKEGPVDGYDLVTAFDAIHDQADPARVLANVATSLRQDGTFLIGDIAASSELENNLGLPYAAFMYTMSTVHCMPVSLGQGGAGLGAAWGVELAEQMLGEAGFTQIEQHRLDPNPFGIYLIARR